MTNKRLDNKIALVVGGSTGIGRATAVAFAKAGAKVVVASRGETKGQETVELVKQAGTEGLFVQTDVSDKSSVENLIARASDKIRSYRCSI